LSLAIDIQVFDSGPFGPHLMNLVHHLLNGVLLFLTVRLALRAPNLAAHFGPARAHWMGLALALVWIVHPLGVEPVAYATQRSTLLFSGFLLAALYAVLRAHAAPQPWPWRAAAVLALCCGMGSKEDMLMAPLLVILFERAFLLPSWSAMRQRVDWYVAVGATWIVLAVCIGLGPSNSTVGYDTGTGTTALHWLMTQAGIVAHYLQVALVPSDLRTAYDTEIVTNVAEALLPGAFVVAVLGCAAWCWRLRPEWRWMPLGWLGALFFLLLAPTSTIMPIVTEVAAERRVYLPMLFVIAPVLFGAELLLARLQPAGRGVCLGIAVLGLVHLTRTRVDVYETDRSFWQDAVDKGDPDSTSYMSSLVFANQGHALAHAGQEQAAAVYFDKSMKCRDPQEPAVTLYVTSLLKRGRHREAFARLQQLIAETRARGREPDENTMGPLGICLAVTHAADKAPPDDPRLLEAERLLQARVAETPSDTQCWSALGYVLMTRGRLAEAVEAYRRVTENTAEEINAFWFCAQLLAKLGRGPEIPPLLDRMLAAHPHDVALHLRVADFAMKHGDAVYAQRVLERTLQIDPQNRQAADMLQSLGVRPR
jgi:tetratricopeptide (TPR) repeat protein